MFFCAQYGKVASAIADKRHRVIIEARPHQLAHLTGLRNARAVTIDQFHVPILGPEKIARIVRHGGRHQHAFRVSVMPQDRASKYVPE